MLDAWVRGLAPFSFPSRHQGEGKGGLGQGVHLRRLWPEPSRISPRTPEVRGVDRAHAAAETDPLQTCWGRQTIRASLIAWRIGELALFRRRNPLSGRWLQRGGDFANFDN